MAFKIAAICFVLILLCSNLFITVQSKETNQFKQVEVDPVSNALYNNGYVAMAVLTLNGLFDSLANIQFLKHNITQLTLFCPQDQAFFSRKFQQPPLSLLQYHTVPFKLDRHTLEESNYFLLGSKVETLSPNHSLIVTSLPHTGKSTSLNLVKVRDWYLFNNGRIIVHGVDGFFDPSFETRGLVHPKEMNEINPGLVVIGSSIVLVLFLLVICLCEAPCRPLYHLRRDIECPLLE